MKRQAYKQKYNVKNYYDTLLFSYRAMFILIRNKINPIISPKFVERIMLAVTEVNGCEVCSYAHTSLALKLGFSQEEIDSLLSASGEYILPVEAKAIFFAQHYAENKGRPEKEVYEALLNHYEKKQTKVILAAIQVMMLGNVSGLPISALVARFQKRPYQDSSLSYELIMMLSSLIIIPLSFIHMFIRSIFMKKNIRFQKKKSEK